MALPTFSQIVQSMITFLQGSRPDIATQTGSVTNDVIISTVANQLSAEDGTDPSVYSGIQYDQNLTAFVINAATLLPADLDAIGTNYGMTRNPGTQATGTITLRIRNYTTSSPIITVPSGTTVSTLSTSSAPAVSFATTATVQFIPSLAPSYYNPATGFYEQSVGIICQTIGTVGNVPANTITSLVGPGLGIDAVTNTTATFGGTNVESNVAYASRIQIKLSGNNVGTQNGIISLMDTNPSVIEAIVVGPNDPSMTRNQFGGSVDVYIEGQVLTTVTEVDPYTTNGDQTFVLAHQPAVSVASVTGIVGGVPYTFVPTVDYAFELNPNSLFAGSVESGSYITFSVNTIFTIVTVTDGTHLVVSSTSGMTPGITLVQGSASTTVTTITDATHVVVANTAGFVPGTGFFTGFKPDNNSNITITYAYDSLIETLQDLINEPQNNIVGSDVLIKEAIVALINVTASIIILPGFNAATVVTNVQSNLSTYLDALGLGPNIDLSDIVVVIEGTPGVDEVDLSTLILQSTAAEVTTTIPPGQRISLGKNSYPVANTLAISVES